VIENFRELKENYLSDVHLYGETDTEIVVNVIAAIDEKEGLGAKEALKKTLQVVKGSYAFAMIDAENPSVLYAAKNKSPLLIGLGDDFNMVVSDAMAGVQLTNEYVEIHDGEIVMLTKDDVLIETVVGEAIERASYRATVDASDHTSELQ